MTVLDKPGRPRGVLGLVRLRRAFVDVHAVRRYLGHAPARTPGCTHCANTCSLGRNGPQAVPHLQTGDPGLVAGRMFGTGNPRPPIGGAPIFRSWALFTGPGAVDAPGGAGWADEQTPGLFPIGE